MWYRAFLLAVMVGITLAVSRDFWAGLVVAVYMILVWTIFGTTSKDKVSNGSTKNSG